METKTKNSTYPLVMTAVMAAVIAAVSPFAIPIGPISLSLCTLVLYMTPYILGWRRGALATLVFLLVGMVGAPVFTGFQGGMAKVLGPTGGYLAGYIPLVILTGLAVRYCPKNRVLQFLGMLAATAVLYALGTAWFCVQSGSSLDRAMQLCVIPFIPGDLIKMVVATGLGPVLRERLSKAGIHPES
ncbi:biotin transporter BioY [Oscillospiraceae bacterium 50-16]|nr:biotin transporter BioY [Lawsonibacter sp.]